VVAEQGQVTIRDVVSGQVRGSVSGLCDFYQNASDQGARSDIVRNVRSIVTLALGEDALSLGCVLPLCGLYDFIVEEMEIPKAYLKGTGVITSRDARLVLAHGCRCLATVYQALGSGRHERQKKHLHQINDILVLIRRSIALVNSLYTPGKHPKHLSTRRAVEEHGWSTVAELTHVVRILSLQELAWDDDDISTLE